MLMKPLAIIGFVATAAARAVGPLTSRTTSNTTACSRACMTTMVSAILDSMVAKDPFRLPLAEVYKATENTHPAALNMMALWRTVTSTGSPSLLAIDTTQSQAFFSLAITEGNVTTQSMLQGRIKVEGQLITEFEFYINRGRGDDGFALDTENLASNYEQWLSPPPSRQNASRAQLEIIAAASFNSNDNTTIDIASDCQFTEAGWIVKNAACNWMPDRPTDLNYRTPVIDETLGIVVTIGVVPGKVYPYATFSAFIPNSMKSSQETQDEWYAIQKSEGYIYLVEPTEAIGTTCYVFQYYNNQLQGEQFNVFLTGPRNGTAWA